MKKVNIKDVEITDVDEPKKIDFKKIILIILICIVSLVGFFFWSTKVRWDAEISEKENKILYYGQEEVKVDKLDGFYGEKIKLNIKDTEAILMYCTSEYGGECVTGDFNNGFENILRNPTIIINIVILIDLILLLFLLKDKYFGKIKSYIIFGIVLLYGIINIGMVVFEVANYYYFVNDSEYVAKGKIVRQLVTDNTKEYYPVVEYTTEQGDFVTYIEVPVNGQIKDDLKDKRKITIYYDKVDNEIATTKQSLIKYILPLMVGIGYLLIAIIYLIKSSKVDK